MKLERYFYELWSAHYYIFDRVRGYGAPLASQPATDRAVARCNSYDDAERIVRLLNADDTTAPFKIAGEYRGQ